MRELNDNELAELRRKAAAYDAIDRILSEYEAESDCGLDYVIGVIQDIGAAM